MDEDQQREQLFSQLEKQYPRLDTALIRPYALDYDPFTNLSELRSALDEIAAVTLFDDDETFDASGTGGYAPPNSSKESYEPSSANEKKSSEPTSLGSVLDQSSESIENELAAYNEALNPLEEMGDGEKMQYLMEMFKDQNRTNVEFVLKKTDGSFKQALDLLLNYEFLEGENLVKKGVDGFDADHITEGYTKVKKRGKNKKYPPQSISDQDFPGLPQPSPWQSPISSPRPTRATPKQAERIIPQYKPLQLDADTGSTWTTVPNKKSTPSKSEAYLSPSQSIADSYQKSAYYHGIVNSKNHFGLAAAHYAGEARRQNAAWKDATAKEADALVARQSSATHIDLHGVSTVDARRIAPAKVLKWWDGLGEKRLRFRGSSGIGDGFRIIIGRGRHSAGGKSVLGPAVIRALVQEGWKMEVTDGEIYVTGRQ